MKDSSSNLVEFKINENYKREKKSPIRTLLRLTVNSKSKKNISIEKRKAQNNNINSNKLSKVSSAQNMIQNYQNTNIIKNKKILESYNNNENLNINSNNNILLKKISNYNNLVKNNKNITVNCMNNPNNYLKKKNEQNIKIKNVKHKKLKIENHDNNNYSYNYYIQKNSKNIATFDNIKSYNSKNNYLTKNKEIKPVKNNVNINTNTNTNSNNNITFFNSRFEISNKKDEKKEDKFNKKESNIINKKINIKNKEEIERPNTNRNSSCINFYNKYLKKNLTKKSNKQKIDTNIINNYTNTNITVNRKTINSNTNNNKYIYKEIIQSYSTINNDELYSNRFSLKNKKNKKNMQNNQNNNVIVNIKNENINTVNNILINTQKDQNSIIYSPKKGIYRVHSQGNVISKRIEEPYNIKEQNIIYKNKSAKDLSNYTYSKKKYLPSQRNSDAYIRKYGIIDISDSSPIKNESKNETKNNINSKIYNVKTLINKDEVDYLNDSKYQMEPDIYPEIKINLKKKKYKKLPNNSVIIEGHNNYNLNDIDDNNANDYNNFTKKINSKISSIYNKYKQNNNKKDINTNNSNRNFNNNSNISNINKSSRYSNSNISFITIPDSKFNNYINNVDITNKNLKTNYNDKILSINDLYYILIFEEKIKDIFNLLLQENFNYISNYCFDSINFFCGYSVNKFIQNVLYNKIDLKRLSISNNYTIFAIIVFYELSFNENNFKNVQIIIKEIVKLIYSNIILVIKQSNNILKYLEKEGQNNVSELYDIINNILNKYINNKELYINDNEYVYLNQNSNNNIISYEEKIYYNLNFIIRNIHTIMGNIRNNQNYEQFLNLLDIINNISNEEINLFFRTKILRVNIFNSSLLSSIVLENNYPNSNQNKILKKRVISPYITNINKKKYTLILSLDDTIVHFKANTYINNKGIVQIRPGLLEFLENIKNNYEIIVFSSGNQKYSDAIIDSIDEKYKFIDYRLYQEHCVIINNDFVKDLSKVGRPIDKMVIVDNMFQNYRLQKDNGINIKSFYGDNSNDKALFYLSKILIKLARDGGDLRKGIKRYWNEIVFKISSNLFNNFCK